MPRVRWGIKASDVDEFDRDSQYKPYDGPIPSNGVYQFQVKVLKYAAATSDKLPQLRIGLELVPRAGRKDERKYGGYFIMMFAPVSTRTAFRYVPFLDAIGVSGDDFERSTVTDNEGNITKIGKWRNDGQEIILAELKDSADQNGNARKDVGWMGYIPEGDDEGDEEIEEEDYEETEEDGF
jgi:hypothetical protein